MRGSVMKRGKTWSYVLYLGRDADGKQRQKWVGGFPTRRLADAALVDALDRRSKGTWADAGRMTVGEYLEEWLAGIRPTVRDKTAASYEATLHDWVLPRIGSQQLLDLNATRLRALYAELLESGRRDGKGGLSARSVQYAHRILFHALKDATESGLLSRNPASLVRAPRVPKREMTVWSAEEAREFLDSLRADRLYALWVLMITTGVRRGEALGLQWRDVDLAKGRLAIRRARVAIGYQVQEAEPKTTAGKRAVSLDSTTVRVLTEHRRRQKEERLAAGPAWMGSDQLFTNEDGSPIHPDRISKLFVQHVRECGLPTIRLHDLRHTAATLALTAGVHPKVVQERLGHANISVTLDTYSHVLEGLQEDAASKVEALVFGS